MEKTKIAFISNPVSIGGGEIYLKSLASAISENQEVLVVTGSGQLEKLLSKLNIKVKRIWLGPLVTSKFNLILHYLVQYVLSPIFFKEFLRLKKEGYTLVHIQTLDEQVAFSRLAKKAGLRVIWTTHGPIRKGTSFFWHIPQNYYLKAARYADKIIAVSGSTKSSLLDLGIDKSKIDVVYNGVDSNRLQTERDKKEIKHSFGIPNDNKVVTFNGRLEPIKGPDLFIEAISKVSLLNTSFVLVSEGSMLKELKQRVQDLGISKKIFFLGYQEYIGEVYSITDLLVIPSRHEGFSLTALEAMMCGIPIIAARVGALPEIIKENNTGLFFDKENIDMLAKTIEQLSNNEELRKKIGNNAKEYAINNFSFDKMVEETLKVYGE